MTQPVVFRRRVQQDLRSAFAWYERQRSGLGEPYLTEVRATFALIGASPELYPAVYGEVRRAIVSRFPFAVFYIIEPSRIVILRVLHTARDPKLWPRGT
jgi:plasmid stabilization system protein ParE